MTTSDDKKLRILIIDDESGVREVLLDLLGKEYDCAEACSAEEALERLREEKFDLVLSDNRMGGMNGLDMIPHVLRVAPETVVVIMSGEKSVESAVHAMLAGAFDFVAKPFNLRYVEAVVRRALDYQSLRGANRLYEARLKDLHEQLTAERAYLASHDTLTRLPNRAWFEDSLNQAVVAAHRSGEKLAVMFVALDRFKKFDDTLGTALADQLLNKVAETVISCAGQGDIVARFGSEEFSLLTQIADAGDAANKALRVSEIFETPINLNGQDLYVTTSVGIAVFPEDGADAQTLLKNAGAALYQAKLRGGNNSLFYKAEMNAGALKRLSLEGGLRRALKSDELTLHYQPQVDLTTGSIVGAEALLRWQHPQMGLILPADFIPLAEDNGLIVPIGEWSLRAACLNHKRWLRAGFGGLSVAVNISPRQLLQSDLVRTITGIINETEMEPRLLNLELTEGSILEDVERATTILRELREIGIKISADDFGSGFSSLAYLNRLPLDVLKMDRLFIRDITKGSGDAAIVRAVITLAHDLDLTVIAEGVEREEQLEVLRAMGCNMAQGYFCKPVPAEEFIEKLIAEGPSLLPPTHG